MVEGDDRWISEIGLVFGKDSLNRFILIEIDYKNWDRAHCVFYTSRDCMSYPMTVGTSITRGQLYQQVLQICQRIFPTDSIVYMFDTYSTPTKSMTVC